MAVKTKAQLKAYFQTGSKPTQAQFEDLIDSTFNEEVNEVWVPSYNANEGTMTWSKSTQSTVSETPALMKIYVTDLDTINHNTQGIFGYDLWNAASNASIGGLRKVTYYCQL